MPAAHDPDSPSDIEDSTPPAYGPGDGSTDDGAATGKKRRNWRALFIELAKFGTVGGASFVIDVGLYNLLVFGPGKLMAENPVTAKIISAGIATVFSWVANRLWTFRQKRTSEPVREFVMFVLVNLGAMAIAAGSLYFSRWVLGLHSQLADNISGNILGNGLGTIFRYLCYRYVVFNPKVLAKHAPENP